MRNALSGKTGTWCGVLQDRLLEFTAVSHTLWKPECSTLLNFTLGSIYKEDMQGISSFFQSFFPLPFPCCLFYMQPSRICSRWQTQLLCFVLAPYPCSCVLQLSVLSSNCFPWWVCIGWPAAPVNACFGVGATADSLLWVVNIRDSIFRWCDWSMKWQSHAFVSWLDNLAFVNYFCQKWSLLCD